MKKRGVWSCVLRGLLDATLKALEDASFVTTLAHLSSADQLSDNARRLLVLERVVLEMPQQQELTDELLSQPDSGF